MFHIVLVCSLLLVTVGQQMDQDWVDPYDMLNYDPTSKTMRKPSKMGPLVPTKRMEYTGFSHTKLAVCNRHLADIQKQNQDQQNMITTLSHQPTCNPVFQRFLSRLLRKIERLGSRTDSADVLYDAKARVSKQTVTEIKTLLDGDKNWRTGTLDNAIGQIAIELSPHDREAWRSHVGEPFGVEIDIILKMGLCVLVIVCIQLWSTVSWVVQFSRLFAVCFCVSVVWNWVYLYKIAVAEHHNNIVMDITCTGVKDWSASLKDWFRSTWTLQADPCKRYQEAITVHPILMVPPTKAISVTLTTFITESMKHVGQGISEFFRALLKDLPVQLQIPVFLTSILTILVLMCAGVNAAFQHGITAPFLRHRNNPHPPELGQYCEGDNPQNSEVPRVHGERIHKNRVLDGPRVHGERIHRNRVRDGPGVNRAGEQPDKVVVETLRHVAFPEEEEHEILATDVSETEHSEDEFDSANQQETQEPVVTAATQHTDCSATCEIEKSLKLEGRLSVQPKISSSPETLCRPSEHNLPVPGTDPVEKG